MMPFPGDATATPVAAPTRSFWLLTVQSLAVAVSLTSLLIIYLPDLPVVGKFFYPFHYQDEIERQAKTYSLDPLLVAAVIRQESGFRPNAKSVVGAVGLMQLMPTTAQWAATQSGLKNYTAARLTEPAINIRLGCWYLNYLFTKFKEPAKVLAAYNGGEGNVDYWGTLKGEQLAFAYPETQNYVAQCLRAYQRYQDLYKGDVARVLPAALRHAP